MIKSSLKFPDFRGFFMKSYCPPIPCVFFSHVNLSWSSIRDNFSAGISYFPKKIISGINYFFQWSDPILGPSNTFFYTIAVISMLYRDVLGNYLFKCNYGDGNALNNYYILSQKIIYPFSTFLFLIEFIGHFNYLKNLFEKGIKKLCPKYDCYPYYSYYVQRFKNVLMGADTGVSITRFFLIFVARQTNCDLLLYGSVTGGGIAAIAYYLKYTHEYMPISQQTPPSSLDPQIQHQISKNTYTSWSDLTTTKMIAYHLIKLTFEMAIWGNALRMLSFFIRNSIERKRVMEFDWIQLMSSCIGASLEPISNFVIAPILSKFFNISQQETIYRFRQLRSVTTSLVFTRGALAALMVDCGIDDMQPRVDACLYLFSALIALNSAQRMLKPASTNDAGVFQPSDSEISIDLLKNKEKSLLSSIAQDTDSDEDKKSNGSSPEKHSPEFPLSPAAGSPNKDSPSLKSSPNRFAFSQSWTKPLEEPLLQREQQKDSASLSFV